MPSPKQPLFVPLGVGLATDVADVLLPQGKVIEIENKFSLRTGELVTRYGNIQIPSATVDGSTIPQPWELAVHGDGLVSLGVPGAHPLHTWSPAANKWAHDAGNAPAVVTDRRGPIKPTRTQLAGDGRNPTVAYVGGYYFRGHQTLSSTGTIINHQLVIDATSGETVYSTSFDSLVVATVLAHMVVTVGTTHAVFVSSHVGPTLLFSVWTLASLASGPSAATIGVGNTLVPRLMDVMGDTTTARVVYRNGAGNVAGVDINPATLATTAWTFTDAAAAVVPIDGTLGWMTDIGAAGKLAIMTSSLAQGVRVQWDVPSAGAARQAATTYTLDAAAGFDVRRITGFTRTNAATGEFTVAWTLGTVTLPSTTDRTNIYHRAGGIILGATPIYRSMSLASKAWTYGGDYYAIAGFLGSVEQATYYVIRIPGPTNLAFPAPLAIIAPGAAEWVSSGSFCAVANPSTGKFVTAANVGIRLAGAGISTAVIASDLITIEHSRVGVNDGMGAPAQALGCLFVPGGTLGMFDGTALAEAGFAYGPEALTLTANATPGGLTPASTYFWASVFAYPDGQGGYWRSKPSVITSRLIGAETSQNVRSQTLRTLGRDGVIVEFYRGRPSIATFLQKVGQLANDPTVDTVTFVDSMTDATLDLQTPLYTNGGVLRNDTLPSSLCVLAAKNRVFVVSADNRREIWPSNPIVAGEGLMFSESTIITIDDAYGDLTAIADVDDKVAPFKKNAVYAFNGDGPDVLNRGGFSEPQIVARGVGTTNPRSIVSTKDGILFQTAAVRPVIEMLDRSLTIARGSDGQGIGSAVQRYPETIMQGILVAKQNQARFYTASGRTLVLDLVSGLWVTFTGQSAQAAVVWNDVAVYATTAATVLREDDTGATYTDAGIQYARFVMSPWIQAAGVKGFEHVISLQGMGQTVGDHTLQVTLYQNYDQTDVAASQPFTMTTAARALWNWQVKPRYRRSAAFRVVLFEQSATAGAKINGVAFELAVRRGLARRKESDRV